MNDAQSATPGATPESGPIAAAHGHSRQAVGKLETAAAEIEQEGEADLAPFRAARPGC